MFPTGTGSDRTWSKLEDEVGLVSAIMGLFIASPLYDVIAVPRVGPPNTPNVTPLGPCYPELGLFKKGT